jgi:uncharacterized membrane protein SpoIIM required for sporulation
VCDITRSMWLWLSTLLLLSLLLVEYAHVYTYDVVVDRHTDDHNDDMHRRTEEDEDLDK